MNVRGRFLCSLILSLFGACVLCDRAFADPDVSVVRALVASEKAKLHAVGRTRVDLVLALAEGLKECEVETDGVTVGPWLRLPKNTIPKTDRSVVTVCASPSFEGSDTTVYLAVTPNTSLRIIAAVTNKLQACGMTDVRLLSDETIDNLVTESTVTEPIASETPTRY